MSRLYLQLYLALVAILVIFAGVLSAWWWLENPERRGLDTAVALARELAPATELAPDATQQRVAELGDRLQLDLTLRGRDDALLAAAGPALDLPPHGRRESGWVRGRGPHGVAALQLEDGRWLLVRARGVGHHSPFGFVAVLAALGGAVALGAWPLARRLAGRIERLRRRVDALGAGDLSARVPIEGRDEVADLARSFNRAAERIEALVAAQRRMLAHASHELRSPLARLRMASELLADEARPDLRAQIERDVAELDDLIGEILLASRLDADAPEDPPEPVELAALVADEAARLDAPVALALENARVLGYERLLRRLVRNLLENARRHGGSRDLAVELSVGSAGEASLRVLDRGPGVPESERERIFEPFYRPPGAREDADGGYGLGLALVHRIARLHGGEVRCGERDGGGTVMEATLGRETA